MHGFTKVGFGRDRYPKEPGAYNCIIMSRDGFPVIRVLHFDNSREFEERWLRVEISEYGYIDHAQVNADYISYYQKIEGVELQIVPEVVTLKIDGITEPDENE